ncbi:putative glycine receptor subunit alphaZ1 [Penaeus vannamei]|uniref:Putative glycine receptor subunit alphaZ1 n=1 Tax=Penaeus vannamei TaxID=6689 RepID=A0A423SQC9_PENVA|nr:glutamate-gated chloride channel alpha-like isoform X2 [Penaeus vannamei]ROT66393.1 putative glycine receptor subunit alphaZ1 [Penaeus vannamei]
MEASVFLVAVMLALAEAQVDLLPASYLKHVRPKTPDGSPLRVGVSWHVSRIHQVDVDAMTVQLSVRPGVAWVDPRLNYTGEDHRDDHAHLLPLTLEFLEHAWKPDLFFLDMRDVRKFEMIDEVAGLWLLRNLTLYLSFLAMVTVDCPMRFHAYPFDVQNCSLAMTSYEYNREEVSLFWLPEGVSSSHQLTDQLPGYDLRLLPAVVTTHSWCQDCFLEPASALQSGFILSRRFSAHLLNAYVPSGLFVVVAWASFFWPPEVVPGRTVLVVTSLLTVVSMYTGVRATSPHTDYLKAIDIWFFMCILFNVLVLLQFGTVITLRRCQEKAKSAVVAPAPKGGAPHRLTPDLTQVKKLQRWEYHFELASKVLFPVAFVVFNLVYWGRFLSHREWH